MGESKTKTLLRGTRAILSYRRERDLLIKQVTSIIARLQTRPQGSDLVEITLNIGSLPMQANKVKWASENLTVEAKDMRYVTSQPYPDFFDKVIPKRCVQLSAVSKHYYHALVTHALHPIKRIEEIERTAAVDLHVTANFIDYLGDLEKMMMFNPCRSSYVARFKDERAALRSQLRKNAGLLKAHPQVGERGLDVSKMVSDALFELVVLVDRLRDAAVEMDVKTRGNHFVTEKPFAFYSHDVPNMCQIIVASLRHWADILVNRDGRRTDGIVVEGIEYMLAHMEF